MTTESGPAPGDGSVPDVTDRYGPDELHLVDLFAARGRMHRGLVVLLHGGFWRRRWDRTHLYPMAVALSEEGYTVALPEYRRVGDAGGGWPGTGDDVLLLLETVPELVRRRFGDAAADRITLVGHSAGGHLALWSQTRAVTVDAVVALAGVLDLAAAHRERLSVGAVSELLGGADQAEFSSILAGADPMQLPVPADVALTLVHGSLDDEVPASYSRGYADRDARITLQELPDAGHYELIDPTSGAWPAVLAALGRH
ncbi:alpha/beta hydrolase family protein [Herbiconiux ginsengi]|uniref:Acetyl esterase/lipase n=1 Tax=Herbiconiux ginsengi TaxID=381665 RepID=A0A1H3KVI8_9MICO|nr:alpha/beta hydrolase [Herbiconiux ginsengi]SDY56172.1 Acetyl esterase/lipase [Herbiconiux ginsengi]